VLAERMRETLGQPIIVENVGGAGASAAPLARGPNGYTLGALVTADAKKWWPLIREFGITAE